ncbi:MAG: fused MFS/spermidine synthase [Planctomycetes bacterium]|nr:fused MFS/spermidine synthase [Planctomycetota bacterium]
MADEDRRGIRGVALPTRFLVPAAAFLCGAAVMVVELLGVRLIAPVFGAGLHVWAALISTALAGLAIGYFAGGRLADRAPGPRLYFSLVLVSGLLVAALPLYASALIGAFAGAGLRTGALLAAAVTFLPPLVLLGATGPPALRAVAHGLDEVGRKAGGLYALSTLGSVAGTLLTGFVLAPELRIDDTLRLFGLAVALPGALGLLLCRRARAAGAGLLLLGVSFFVPGASPRAAFGTPVFAADTPFQRVEVTDHRGERWLFLDGCVHSRMALGPPADPGASYIRLFRFLPAFRPEARSLLMLGLGAGALAPLLSAEDYRITAVEIDPVVVTAARERFGTLGGIGNVIVGDARTFVRRATERFDLVALDVCGSDWMPEHLVTREFFREVRGVLAPGGVLAVNAIGEVGGRALAALGATLRDVYPHADAFAGNPEGPLTNVVFYASDEPLVPSFAFEDEAAASRYPPGPGDVLTDQRNPVNHWNAGASRLIRRTRAERY